MLALIIGGGFDTTTALTAHAVEWLSLHPGERERLSQERDLLLDSATEEFLRYYTPAPGNGRTIAEDCTVAGVELREGERLWLFKRMMLAVLDRMPDYRCIPEETVHYDTIAVIQGMRHLQAEFTPGSRLGPGLDETLDKLQRVCDEQRLAEPVTARSEVAQI